MNNYEPVDVVCERPDILRQLNDDKWFVSFFFAQYRLIYLPINLTPVTNEGRLINTYDFWQEDLERLRQFELNGGEPDQYKTMGHLCYWLRRCQPIVAVINRNTEKKYGQEFLNGDEEENYKRLLFQYGSEYSAFDIAYRIVRYLTMKGKDSSQSLEHHQLSRNYIETVVHMLKTKNVSPHALALNFRSLFLHTNN